MEKNYNFLIVLIHNWKQGFRMYFHILKKWQEIFWKTENYYNFWDHSQCHNNCFENEHFWQESDMLCFFENCSILVVKIFEKYECKTDDRFLVKTVFWKAYCNTNNVCLCQIVTTRIFSFFNNFTRMRNSFLCFPTTILCLICFNKPNYESLRKG